MGYEVNIFLRDTKRNVQYPKSLVRYGNNDFNFRATFWQVASYDKFEAIAEYFKWCELTYVDYGKLQRLSKICEHIRKDHSLAPQLLSTKQGYDEDYFSTLEYTRKLMNRLVRLLKKDDNIYDCFVEIS